MKFNKFLDKMKEKYDVKELSEGRYSISNGEKVIEIHESNIYDPLEIDQFFNRKGPAIGDFGHVGRDDLFPDFGRRNILHTARRRVKGPLVDPDSDIFHSVEEGRSSSSSESNPLIKVDPITPSKKNKKGFTPDPDHFKKPNGDSKFPF